MPDPVEVADPKAETKPSGMLVATARAFSPARVGIGKTIGAVALVLAHLLFLLSLDKGWLAANGSVALFMAGAVGPLVGLALRHLGSRWK